MSGMPSILLLNGPNLDLLGLREPEIYGSATLDDHVATATAAAEAGGFRLDHLQSNHEGELVGWIQEARGRMDGIVINPAGYTTNSVAILDALLLTDLPVVEVHLSNIHRREAFRQHSLISQAARGVICGLGAAGYRLAIDALAEIVATQGKR